MQHKKEHNCDGIRRVIKNVSANVKCKRWCAGGGSDNSNTAEKIKNPTQADAEQDLKKLMIFVELC